MSRITEQQAAEIAELNNIYKNFPDAVGFPTAIGGWVWITPVFPSAIDLYKSGQLQGFEPAPSGVILLVRPPTPAPIPTTPTPSTPATPPVSDGGIVPPSNGGDDSFGLGDDGTFSDSDNSVTYGTGQQISSPYNSDILTAYIREELKKEFFAEFGQDSYYGKSIDRFARGISRAIKKYLIVDVRAKDLGLTTDAVTLQVYTANGSGQIEPNPHDHPIQPHGHNIIAP